MWSRALFLLPEVPLYSCWVVLTRVVSNYTRVVSRCLVFYSCCLMLCRVVLLLCSVVSCCTHVMSCERVLNFDQWKTFSENCKPIRVWLWLAYKFTENSCRLQLLNSKGASFLPWQNKYPNLKSACHIKPKIFL